MKTVTASEANRNFSALLREVAKGQSIVVTSRGKPVATIAPPARAEDADKLEKAKRRFIAELRRGSPLGPITWTRDELYEG